MGMSREDLLEMADECGWLEDPEERFIREMEEKEAMEAEWAEVDDSELQELTPCEFPEDSIPAVDHSQMRLIFDPEND